MASGQAQASDPRGFDRQREEMDAQNPRFADTVVRPTKTSSDEDAEDLEARLAVRAIDPSGMRPINEVKRFAILTACAFAMICSSTSYSYNLFSAELQRTYNLDFRSVSTINTVGMCFCYFLMPYGIICDYFGPSYIYMLGAGLFALGALLFGLTFQGVITGSVVKFCVFNACLSLGAQLFDLATVTVSMSVFPTRRGWAIAILKTMIGLAQAIIASIRAGFFLNANANYFYFLMGLVVVCSSGIIPIVRLPKYHLTGYELSHLTMEQKMKRTERSAVYLTQDPPMWRFYYGVAIILILVAYLPMTSALLAFTKLPPKAPMVFAIICIIMTMMLLGMMVPFPYLDRLTTRKSRARRAQLDGDATSTSHSGEPADPPGAVGTIDDGVVLEGEGSGKGDRSRAARKGEVETDVDYIAPQYQTTFLQSCCTLKLWAIFFTMFCGLGCEFVIIYNARYIYAALDGATPDATVSVLLSVINGAGSALGRLGMSAFEMLSQNRPPEKRVPITIAFFVPTSVIIVSIVLFLTLPGRSLLFAYAIAALGNGFAASITILVIRTLYAKDPAKHYNFSINSLVPASVLINRLLFGEWYARQSEKNPTGQCLKKSCVIMPLVVMLGLNLAAFASTIYVHFSYRRFCNKVLAESRRIKAEAAAAAAGCGAGQGTSDEDLGTKPHLPYAAVVGEPVESPVAHRR